MHIASFVSNLNIEDQGLLFALLAMKLWISADSVNIDLGYSHCVQPRQHFLLTSFKIHFKGRFLCKNETEWKGLEFRVGN